MSTDHHAGGRPEARATVWLFAVLTAFTLLAAGVAVTVLAPDDEAAATGSLAAPAPAAVDEHSHDEASHSTSPTTAAPAGTVDGAVVVSVRMDEFAFTPDRVEVPVGQPVVFRVTNAGMADHELVIGDAHVQDEAEEAMRDGGTGHDGGHHGDVPSIYLGPGEDGDLTATFDAPGELLLGCHVPGHWGAGMRGTLAAV